MDRRFSLALILMALIGCGSAPAEKEDDVTEIRVPQSEQAQQGTLANRQLINDVMQGVVAKVAAEGCAEPRDFKPYVTRMPEGEPGERAWAERWVIFGCGKEYPVPIRFQEAGLGAANWAIQ